MPYRQSPELRASRRESLARSPDGRTETEEVGLLPPACRNPAVPRPAR